MIIHILRKLGSKKTCDGLIQKMNEVLSNLDLSYTLKLVKNSDVRPNETPDVLFRWNCKDDYAFGKFEVNSPEMLDKMNNKIKSRRILIANGIPVPKTYFSKEEALLNCRNFPLIGRQQFHSQGRKMKTIRNRRKLRLDRRSRYWSEFIPKDKEFRVHVFFGRILEVSEKIPNNPNLIAWNNSLNNGIFRNIKWAEWPKDVCVLALKTAQVLDVDFAAIDIIKKDENCYVLESNTAPQCSEYRQTVYAKAFCWLIKKYSELGTKPPRYEFPTLITSKKLCHPVIRKPRILGPEEE